MSQDKPSNILVLLGNENEQNGALSVVSKLRADGAVEFLKEHDDYKVLPTGAFGDGFNTSHIPHGELLTRYLTEHGITKDGILPFTRTSNTVEDAYGVLRTVKGFSEVNKVVIVSSNFHMGRVKYIFGRTMLGYNLEYLSVPDPANFDKGILEGERNKLNKLKKEWVDIAGFDLNNFPEKSYEQIGHEFRHYDNFSYFAVGGAFVSCGYSLSHDIIYGNGCVIQYVVTIFLVAVLWYLYARLANTAFAAQRVMIALEKLYAVPGLSSARTIFPLGIKLSGSQCQKQYWHTHEYIDYDASCKDLLSN